MCQMPTLRARLPTDFTLHLCIMTLGKISSTDQQHRSAQSSPATQLNYTAQHTAHRIRLRRVDARRRDPRGRHVGAARANVQKVADWSTFCTFSFCPHLRRLKQRYRGRLILCSVGQLSSSSAGQNSLGNSAVASDSHVFHHFCTWKAEILMELHESMQHCRNRVRLQSTNHL